MPRPVSIKKTDANTILITWQDGTIGEISGSKLRENCPSAVAKTARGEIDHDKPLSPTKKGSLRVIKNSITDETRIEKIWLVGNYAIGIEYGDGHKTGIYPFPLLQSLSQNSLKLQDLR